MTHITSNQMLELNGGSWGDFFTGVTCGGAVLAGVAIAVGTLGWGTGGSFVLAASACGYGVYQMA